MSTQRNFTVSTPAQNVRADSEGDVQIVYTVANTSGLPNRGMARIVPLGDTRAEWLALEGQNEREFPVGAIHQFTVSAKLPPDASGRYSLRLDVLSARKGGEESYAGPVVTIEATATAAAAKPSRWWLWAAAVVLLLMVGVAGALVMRDKPREEEPVAEATDTVTAEPTETTDTKPIEPKLVTVPNLISTPVAKAEWELEATGLKAVRKEVIDRAATPGTVRMQTPKPGAQVDKGAIVELEVVIAEDLVTVPDVVGTPWESAKPNIEKAGLVAASQNTLDYTKTIGTVVSQSPAGGTDVKRGTKVTATVASNHW